MGAYLGYTAIIWLIALGVTGKHTFVMSLFEDRDSILEKGMIGLLLFPVWAFSVIFLPLFIWYQWSEHRAKIRWEKMAKDDVKRKEEKETEFDGHWGDGL